MPDYNHNHDLIGRLAAELKAPVDLGPAVGERIMAAIAGTRPDPARGWLGESWRWLREPRWIAVSPLRGLAVAAVVVAVVLVGGRFMQRPRDHTVEMQFVYVDPRASSVALVGEFNGWDPAATLLTQVSGDGIWRVTLPLRPGRYHYSFVVDGTQWSRDPAAPRAVGEHFDRPTSAVTVTVGGGDTE